MQIQTTQFVLDNLVHLETKKDYYIDFLYLLIRKKADKKPTFIYSGLLKDIFGDKNYIDIRNHLKQIGLIDFSYNKIEGGYYYITYHLKFKIENLIDYTLTDVKLIKRINNAKKDSFYSLPDYIKKMYYNIGELLSQEKLNLNPYISKSPTTGRIFHSLTTISSSKRKELLHKSGEQLIEIDAKNAQLVFLSELYKEDINFNNDVYNGMFYENLAKKMNLDITDSFQRKEFKRKFFNTFLFNENKIIISNSKYSDAFQKSYPLMYNFIITLKSDLTKANQLQKMESEFFINNLAKDLIENDIWLVTIHDALIVKNSDLNTVIDKLNSYSILFLGRHFKYSIEEGITSLDQNTPLYSIYKREEEEEEIGEEKNYYSSVNSNSDMIPYKFDRNKHNKELKLRQKENTLQILKETYKSGMSQKELVSLSGKSIATVKRYWKNLIINNMRPNNTESMDNTIKSSKELETTSKSKLEHSIDNITQTKKNTRINELKDEFNYITSNGKYKLTISEFHLITNNYFTDKISLKDLYLVLSKINSANEFCGFLLKQLEILKTN